MCCFSKTSGLFGVFFVCLVFFFCLFGEFVCLVCLKPQKLVCWGKAR